MSERFGVWWSWLLPLLFLFPFFTLADEKFNEGYRIFKKRCASCHIESISLEKLAKVEKMVKKGKRPPFNAPPMTEISARVKHFYPKEEDFINFVKDYIENPSREKGVCLPLAFKVFGVMPPIKGLSEKEKEAVAYWLYHNFKLSWEEIERRLTAVEE